MGDVEMVDAKKNVLPRNPSVQWLIGQVRTGVKTKGLIGIRNPEDKTDYQSDSNGEDFMNVRSEIENQLNSKSQTEAHENVVYQEKTFYKAYIVVKMLNM